MRPSFVVLLSAGLDSTVNLLKAKELGPVKLVLTFDYGQRASSREISKASALAGKLGIEHKVVSVPFIKSFGKSSLISDLEVPVGDDVQIHDHQTSLQTAAKVWVPNRNGIFLNIAAGFAEALGASHIVPGFNFEEASTFPDNSSDFMKALDASFSYSTSNHVKVMCFTDQLNKTQIVRMGLDLGLDLSDIWPCYLNLDRWCGQCESCQRSKFAMIQNGLDIGRYFIN